MEQVKAKAIRASLDPVKVPGFDELLLAVAEGGPTVLISMGILDWVEAGWDAGHLAARIASSDP